MVEFQPVPSAVVLAAALVAAITDVWKFRVPNTLTLPLMAAGVIYHLATGGMEGAVASLVGMLCGFGVLILFYLTGGYGGGDVKLMAAFGAWLGAELTFYVFVASSLAGGVYALLLIVLYGQLSEVWTRCKIAFYRLATLGRHLGVDDGAVIEAGQINRRRVVPFAAMLCLGVIATFVWLWLARPR